jgi:hypothetical protein
MSGHGSALRRQLSKCEVMATELRSAKDNAYSERNRCVAFMVQMARALHWPVWLGLHDEEDDSWDREWMHIIFIESPVGQLSWHVHDSEVAMFRDVPLGTRDWDGHTTDEKYRRMSEWMP